MPSKDPRLVLHPLEECVPVVIILGSTIVGFPTTGGPKLN